MKEFERELKSIKYEIKMLRKELFDVRMNEKKNGVKVRENIRRGKEKIEGVEIIFSGNKKVKCNDKCKDLSIGLVCDVNDECVIIYSMFIGRESDVRKYLNSFGGADIVLFK